MNRVKSWALVCMHRVHAWILRSSLPSFLRPVQCFLCRIVCVLPYRVFGAFILCSLGLFRSTFKVYTECIKFWIEHMHNHLFSACPLIAWERMTRATDESPSMTSIYSTERCSFYMPICYTGQVHIYWVQLNVTAELCQFTSYKAPYEEPYARNCFDL